MLPVTIALGCMLFSQFPFGMLRFNLLLMLSAGRFNFSLIFIT